ncbi:trypsin-like peptidase domain-containing protein [Paractinoplanes lichenicola]|uniref:Serine protease n=1 Tax=Paractinoplanes lichenicola TaxID=2802976 RepID=A0ABS1VXS3_9ACTN|nr:trypsin-like peptidase domain-containing protein [Actinoplanes lichenicola]MBL7259239.1 trypsin-like peptidase domain-containing protein [Actinoplanes lichenicola]
MLETFPYPWAEKWAQQLHTTLTQLFPSRAQLSTVAAAAGVDTTQVNVEQAIARVWWEVLDYTGRTGLTRELVATALDQLPKTSPYAGFLHDLLDDRPVRTEGEPRGSYGAPRFLHDDDQIMENEARLYRDDLTMQIGRVPALVTTLNRLVELAPAVCKLTVSIGGEQQEGTAFRIGLELLLTNWHVLHDEKTGIRATAAWAEFGFEDDPDGSPRTATRIGCDVATIVSDEPDDWAVIRATDPLHESWPVIALSTAAEPEPRTPAYIVQHPGGLRKRLGYVRNQISYVDDRVVHYLTDTVTGSSGSPVFDAAGALIAVHHAGGRPQEVLGLAPTKKNEGIRIPRIVAGLAAAGVQP